MKFTSGWCQTALCPVYKKGFLKLSLEMKPQDDGDTAKNMDEVFHSWFYSATGGKENEGTNDLQPCFAKL